MSVGWRLVILARALVECLGWSVGELACAVSVMCVGLKAYELGWSVGPVHRLEVGELCWKLVS